MRVSLVFFFLDRDVYLEGLKRRAEALQPVLGGRNGQSYMCLIQ